jgi:hypothetical protein
MFGNPETTTEGEAAHEKSHVINDTTFCHGN